MKAIVMKNELDFLLILCFNSGAKYHSSYKAGVMI